MNSTTHGRSTNAAPPSEDPPPPQVYYLRACRRCLTLYGLCFLYTLLILAIRSAISVVKRLPDTVELHAATSTAAPVCTNTSNTVLLRK